MSGFIRRQLSHEIIACLSVFVICASIIVAIDWSTMETGRSLTREGGGIETMSVLGYLMALGIYIRTRRGLVFWPVPVLLLALSAREIDADKLFTSEGILSLGILTRDTLLYEKVLALGVWVGLASALISLSRSRAMAEFDGVDAPSRRHRNVPSW